LNVFAIVHLPDVMLGRAEMTLCSATPIVSPSGTSARLCDYR
jgi:hypothetical protein